MDTVVKPFDLECSNFLGGSKLLFPFIVGARKVVMCENERVIIKSALAHNFDKNWPFLENEKCKFYETLKNGFLMILYINKHVH